MKLSLKTITLSVATWIAVGLLSTGSAPAATLTGSLFFNGGGPNYYDPANGFVPAGFSNSSSNIVTVAGFPITFGYQDGTNTDNTTFSSATSFTFQDQVTNSGGNASITLQFVSSVAGFFTGFAKQSDNFPGGFTDTISSDGTTITLNWAGGSVTNGQVFDATFVGTAVNPVPLPGALPLFASGLVGLGLLGRRRKKTAAG
jgi:hypothetical protein